MTRNRKIPADMEEFATHAAKIKDVVDFAAWVLAEAKEHQRCRHWDREASKCEGCAYWDGELTDLDTPPCSACRLLSRPSLYTEVRRHEAP